MPITTLSLVNGKSAVLKATFYDSQGNICEPVSDVTWATSDGTIVSYMQTGTSYKFHKNSVFITAIKSGTATITAQSVSAQGGTITASVAVTTYDNTASTLGINLIP